MIKIDYPLLKLLPLIIFSMLFLASCEEKLKPSIMEEFVPGQVPTQESWNNTMIFSDSGKTKAILKVGHIKYYSTTFQYIFDENVQVDFFNRDGLHNSILTSKKAIVYDDTKDMIASENVKVISDSGTVVQTEQLKWINSSMKLIGDQFVTITTKSEIIQGYGFESDQNLKDYIIKKVSGVVSSDNLIKK